MAKRVGTGPNDITPEQGKLSLGILSEVHAGLSQHRSKTEQILNSKLLVGRNHLKR